MSQFFPFRALRPAKGKAGSTACLPYDVLSEAQARELAVNPSSFIHVIKSEADLPEGTDLYSDMVYQTAAANCQHAAHIQSAADIPAEFFNLSRIGITAGASTPDEIIEGVALALKA